MLGGILDGLKGKNARLKGSVVLMRKNVLDLNDFGATIIDGIGEFLGKGVTCQLISSTLVDPSERPSSSGFPFGTTSRTRTVWMDGRPWFGSVASAPGHRPSLTGHGKTSPEREQHREKDAPDARDKSEKKKRTQHSNSTAPKREREPLIFFHFEPDSP